ncbi:MAG: RDD family protein [Marinicella sp.]|nr:RDD family protein [Xanthomonadales bacterium]
MTDNHKSKLWKHLAALVYDIFPILGLFLVTSLIMVVFRRGEEVVAGTLWFQLLLLSEFYLYFTYSWKKGGQTLGMRAWKIGIADYQQLSWTEVTIRLMIGLVSTILLGLGLWSRLWDKNQQTWMDKVCGCSVIDLQSTRQQQ